MLLEGLAAGIGIAVFALIYRWRPLTVEKQIWIALVGIMVGTAIALFALASSGHT